MIGGYPCKVTSQHEYSFGTSTLIIVKFAPPKRVNMRTTWILKNCIIASNKLTFALLILKILRK